MEYETTAYATIAGFSAFKNVDEYEIPCAMCMRERAAGVTVWGSNVCPSGSTRDYAGYATGDASKRGTLQCVQESPQVVRWPCSPAKPCPADGSPLTQFIFENNVRRPRPSPPPLLR